MNKAQRYYPFQGSRKFETNALPLTKSIRYSCTANTADATTALLTFKKGTFVLGFQARVTASFTSGGNATLQLGFSTMCGYYSSAVKVASLTLNTMWGLSSSGVLNVGFLTADDTFDAVVGTTPMTAGEMDIHIMYVPPMSKAAGSDIKQYLIT